MVRGFELYIFAACIHFTNLKLLGISVMYSSVELVKSHVWQCSEWSATFYPFSVPGCLLFMSPVSV